MAWTIDDLLEEEAAGERLAERTYLLEDCTSPVVVPGVVDYTDEADAAFERYAAAGMHVVRSVDRSKAGRAWWSVGHNPAWKHSISSTEKRRTQTAPTTSMIHAFGSYTMSQEGRAEEGPLATVAVTADIFASLEREPPRAARGQLRVGSSAS